MGGRTGPYREVRLKEAGKERGPPLLLGAGSVDAAIPSLAYSYLLSAMAMMSGEDTSCRIPAPPMVAVTLGTTTGCVL